MTTRTCSFPKCRKPHYGKGFCRLHYKRAVAGITQTPCEMCGSPTPKAGARFCGKPCQMKWHRRFGCYTDKRQLESRGTCSIEGCEKPVHAKGMCRAHSIRMWRNGDPLVIRRRQQSNICIKCGAPSAGASKNMCEPCYLNDYYRKNQQKERARRNARRRHFERITPRWADRKAIRNFYAVCPAGMEVDHVIPIGKANKKVCGLHVLENLQYLTPDANKRKGNRFDESFHKPVTLVSGGRRASRISPAL